jgi:hypothetical protein
VPDETITTVGPDDVEQVEWELAPLVDGDEQAGALRLLDEAEERARAFADAHAGKVADLDAAGLREAMLELGAIE